MFHLVYERLTLITLGFKIWGLVIEVFERSTLFMVVYILLAIP